jgi:hypothetical protein
MVPTYHTAAAFFLWSSLLIGVASSQELPACETYSRTFEGWAGSFSTARGYHRLQLNTELASEVAPGIEPEWDDKLLFIGYTFKNKRWSFSIPLPHKFTVGKDVLEIGAEADEAMEDCILQDGECTYKRLLPVLKVTGKDGKEVFHRAEGTGSSAISGGSLDLDPGNAHTWAMALQHAAAFEIQILDVDGAIAGKPAGTLVTFRGKPDGLYNGIQSLYLLGQEQSEALTRAMNRKFSTWRVEAEAKVKNYVLNFSTEPAGLLNKELSVTTPFPKRLALQYRYSDELWTIRLAMPWKLDFPGRRVAFSTGDDCTKVNGSCVATDLRLFLMNGDKIAQGFKEGEFVLRPAIGFPTPALDVVLADRNGRENWKGYFDSRGSYLFYLFDNSGTVTGKPKSVVAGWQGSLDGFNQARGSIHKVVTSLKDIEGKDCNLNSEPAAPPTQPTAATVEENVATNETAIAAPPSQPNVTKCMAAAIAGTYGSSYGPIVCSPDGEGLQCCYGGSCQKRLSLALVEDGRRLKGEWRYDTGENGPAEFTLKENCALADGLWGYSPYPATNGWSVAGRM